MNPNDSHDCPIVKPRPEQIRELLLQEIEARAVARGMARGMVHGMACGLLCVLASRKIDVDEATRERILACTDTAQIERWLDRALMAQRLSDVFDAT